MTDSKTPTESETLKAVAKTPAEIELAKLKARLAPIDPGGSDRLDELEQAIEFARHRADTIEAKYKSLHAAVVDLVRDLETMSILTAELNKVRSLIRENKQ